MYVLFNLVFFPYLGVPAKSTVPQSSLCASAISLVCTKRFVVQPPSLPPSSLSRVRDQPSSLRLVHRDVSLHRPRCFEACWARTRGRDSLPETGTPGIGLPLAAPARRYRPGRLGLLGQAEGNDSFSVTGPADPQTAES